AIDIYSPKISGTPTIVLHQEHLNNIMGIDISPTEITKILSSLSMDVRKEGDVFFVKPPSFRLDITREIDLVEEIIRIYGYDKIPVSYPVAPIVTEMSLKKNNDADIANQLTANTLVKLGKSKWQEIAKNTFTGYGYSEIVTYSFVSHRATDMLKITTDDVRRKLVKIKNPLTEEHAVMRSTLVYSILQTMKHNVNNVCSDLKLFEIGRVFFNNNIGELPEEQNHICALISGMAFGESWHFGKTSAGFYDLKGAVEGFFRQLRLEGVSFRESNGEPFLRPGRAVDIFLNGYKVGFIGELHPDVVIATDIGIVPIVFECNMDVVANTINETIVFKELPKFPPSSRDVAFLLDNKITFDEIVEIIIKQKENLLEKVAVFDVFCGKTLPDGLKSIGIRFTYRSKEKTLTEQEITSAHQKLVESVVVATDAKIR
ncbi:MAG: phenylalanine--tRNA ligase subunit beta, partial [Deltaproteobacteria bacterium]